MVLFFGNATIIEIYSSTDQTTLTLENVTVFLNPKSTTKVVLFFGNATIIEIYSSTDQTTLTLENVTVFLSPKSITFVVLFLWYILVANTFYSRNSMVSNFFSEFSNMNIYRSVSNNDFCSPHFI